MYTAVVLDDRSCRELVERLANVEGWTGDGYRYETPAGASLPHHMTVNLGPFDSTLNDPKATEGFVALLVDAFCWDDEKGVCAARVTDPPVKSTNAQPHVTMCLRPGAKPVASNHLDWSRAVPLTPPLVVRGVVREC